MSDAVVLEPPSVVLLGSVEWFSFEDPLVVAVAVEGKKEAFVPALYDVWYILFLMSVGFRMGSAS